MDILNIYKIGISDKFQRSQNEHHKGNFFKAHVLKKQDLLQ